MFDKNPQWNYIRLSNNNTPTRFTDQEAVTIYLFVGKYIKQHDKKEIHNFAKHYLRAFPDAKKEAGLRMMRQIKLLIKACSVPNAIEEYFGDPYRT